MKTQIQTPETNYAVTLFEPGEQWFCDAEGVREILQQANHTPTEALVGEYVNRDPQWLEKMRGFEVEVRVEELRMPTSAVPEDEAIPGDTPEEKRNP